MRSKTLAALGGAGIFLWVLLQNILGELTADWLKPRLPLFFGERAGSLMAGLAPIAISLLVAGVVVYLVYRIGVGDRVWRKTELQTPVISDDVRPIGTDALSLAQRMYWEVLQHDIVHDRAADQRLKDFFGPQIFAAIADIISKTGAKGPILGEDVAFLPKAYRYLSSVGAMLDRGLVQEAVYIADILHDAPLDPPKVPPLTEDQKAFRIALKQFSLTFPSKLSSATGRVHGELMQNIRDMGDRDYSPALHQMNHAAYSSGSRHLREITDFAEDEIEKMNVEALLKSIRAFIAEYQWTQRIIANLNVITKAPLRERETVKKWLQIDRECWAEIEKLRAWPEGKWLRKISETEMASNEQNWMTPFKVNY